jgi:hypothetical protein
MRDDKCWSDIAICFTCFNTNNALSRGSWEDFIRAWNETFGQHSAKRISLAFETSAWWANRGFILDEDTSVARILFPRRIFRSTQHQFNCNDLQLSVVTGAMYFCFLTEGVSVNRTNEKRRDTFSPHRLHFSPYLDTATSADTESVSHKRGLDMSCRCLDVLIGSPNL